MSSHELYEAVRKSALERISGSSGHMHLAAHIEQAVPGLDDFLKQLRSESANRFLYSYSLKNPLSLEGGFFVNTNIPGTEIDKHLKIEISPRHPSDNSRILEIVDSFVSTSYGDPTDCLTSLMVRAIETGFISDAQPVRKADMNMKSRPGLEGKGYGAGE